MWVSVVGGWVCACRGWMFVSVWVWRGHNTACGCIYCLCRCVRVDFQVCVLFDIVFYNYM